MSKTPKFQESTSPKVPGPIDPLIGALDAYQSAERYVTIAIGSCLGLRTIIRAIDIKNAKKADLESMLVARETQR